MKINDKDVDLSYPTDRDSLNFQSATDPNLTVKEPIKIELTEIRDDRTKQSDRDVQGLMPSMAPDSNLLASVYAIPDSLKNITSLAERYKDLMHATASENYLMASRYGIPESLKNMTSIAERYQGLMPATASDSYLLASRYGIPESLKNFTSLAERYKDLVPSMPSDSYPMASLYDIPESLKNMTSLAERYKGLVPSMPSDSYPMASLFEIPESLKNMTSLAERYKDLVPSMPSYSYQMASLYAIPESLKNITSLAERYRGLISSSSAISALFESRYTLPDSMTNIADGIEKYYNLMPASIRTLPFYFGNGKSNLNTLKTLYNSASSYLENISTSDLHSIIDVAKEYSNTPEGAAYIATKATELTSIEPDAITKLKEIRNKNRYIQKFRELPLPLQLIVYYIIINIFAPIIEDKLKAEALELYTRAGAVIEKSLPANSYISQLISANKEKPDLEVLKQLRVITAHNVRLRQKPSMKGEPIALLDKYDVVSVLDKSDRTWLYVQVLIDGEYVTGWVNRTYTKNLNKN